MSHTTKSKLFVITAVLIAFCILNYAEAATTQEPARRTFPKLFDAISNAVLGIYRILIRQLTGKPSTT